LSCAYLWLVEKFIAIFGLLFPVRTALEAKPEENSGLANDVKTLFFELT